MELENCFKCDSPQASVERYCNSCGVELGYPNVRIANDEPEIIALNSRFKAAKAIAESNDNGDKFESLEGVISNESVVTIAIEASKAIGIVNDTKMLYKNSEEMIESSQRERPAFANDAHRALVGGTFFGSYAKDILYGALSLNGEGLSNYGDVFFKLKNVAVSDRTTFFEKNSYDLFEEHGKTNLPHGYRSDWGNRGKLAAIKFNELGLFSRASDFDVAMSQPYLLKNGRQGKKEDEFIEAHIFGHFNIHSVESIEISKQVDKKNKVVAKLVSQTFAENCK